jgi:hypothetical protein
MNGPDRKGGPPAEATQQLQAMDVLEVIDAPAVGEVGFRKATPSSSSSIAPVGLDLMARRPKREEDPNPTVQIRIPARQRRLGNIVVGALAGCAVILVAAGIVRVVHASDASPSATTASTTPTADPTVASTATATTPPDTATAPAPPPPVAPSTGTVRLDRPATAGHVWLDGKKLSAPSATVSCGTHQIRVGRGRVHSVDVPCGGEVGVSR